MADYTDTIQQAAQSWNVDPTLLQALIQQESGGNPGAVSPAGAQGLTGLMPATAQGMGVTDISDPVQQIYGGAKYLSQALDATKSPEEALLYYHGGPGWQQSYGPESAAYPGAVTQKYAALKKQSQPPAQGGGSQGGADPFTQALKGGDAAAGTDPFTAALSGGSGAAQAPDPFTQTLEAAQKASAPAPAPPPAEPTDQFGLPVSDNSQVANIAKAAWQGAKEGFGSGPIGITPQGETALANAGIYNKPGEYNPLKAINAAVINPLAAAGDLVMRGVGGATQGLITGGAQAGTEVGGKQLGRGVGGVLESMAADAGSNIAAHGPIDAPEAAAPAATEAAAPALTHDATPANQLASGPIDPPQLNHLAPDGSGRMTQLSDRDYYRAYGQAAPNPLASGAPPAPAFVPPGTPAPESATAPAPAFVPPGTQRANPLASEAAPGAGNPLATPEPAAAAPAAAPSFVPPGTSAPVPQPAGEGVPRSVGAAASRDMTAPESIPPETTEQKLTNLSKSVTQSAEDRAGSAMEDSTEYVPGVERSLAARVFTPQNSLDDKLLRANDPAYRAEQEGIERNNNQIMTDLLGKDAGDANILKSAYDARDEVAPPAQQLFEGEKPVDASPLVQQIDSVLAGPAGKRAAVVRTLNDVKSSLFDADGSLETLPSQLYGARQNITDMLKKGVGDGADDVRASKSFLSGMLDTMDPIINEGAPKYQAYLQQFQDASQPINQMEFLQKYQTGPKKLTNVDGYLQMNKVQKMLDDIYQGQKAKGINPAKSLSDDQVQNIVNVRNELAAQSLKDRLAKVKGSDTAQQMNRSGLLGDGPLGTAVKGAAEMGAHALLFHTTGGVGNAVMALHRGIVKPARVAGKAAKAENALMARKAELLNTQPNPLSSP